MPISNPLQTTSVGQRSATAAAADRSRMMLYSPKAALPSLAIVAVGMVPVAALLWALERGARVTS